MGFYIPWLADAARTTGYKVVEVAGWRTRGHGGMRALEVLVGHHTGTPRTSPGDYPSLNVVTNGRAGLPGPLAQYGLGRDGTIYVIAGGLAYHAGASRWAGFIDLNDEAIGIEAESDGSGFWTPQQLDCYPKLVAAILRYMSRGVDRYAAHRDVAVPAGRKPDPTGIDSGWMRATAQRYLTSGIPTTPLEDDVSWTEQLTFTAPDGKVTTIQARDWVMWTNYAAWIAANNTEALKAAMSALMAAVTDGDLDQDAVLARIDTAVREATTAAVNNAINNTVLPALRDTVEDVLGEDNQDTADAILNGMATRLHQVAAPVALIGAPTA